MKPGAITKGRFLAVLVVCLLPSSAAHAGNTADGAGSAVPAPILLAQDRGVAQTVEERALRPQPEPPGKSQVPQAGSGTGIRTTRVASSAGVTK